jgi:general secretion pathway protein L
MVIRGEYWWVYSHGDGIDWAHIMPGQALPAARGVAADWSALPVPAGASVALCIAGTQVRIHKVSIPTGNRQRFMAALPFTLEDQLLQEPEACHFVPLTKIRSRGLDTPVAVLEHATITALLKEVEIYGWRVQLLIPDYLMIPEPEAGVWFLDVTESPWLLRMSEDAGGAALIADRGTQLSGALLLALEQTKSRPQILRVRVLNPQQHERVMQWSSQLAPYKLYLDIEQADSSRSEWLARQALPPASLNLLTGPYTPYRETSQLARRLLPSAALAAALILIAALHWTLQGSQLRSESSELRAAIEATYREAFPDARNIVDPRFQMEQQLQNLRDRPAAGRSNADFITHIEKLAAVIGSGDQYQLQVIGFDGNSTTLEVSVPDYDALDRLQTQLAQTASVNIENAELKSGRVYSRIRLRGQG